MSQAGRADGAADVLVIFGITGDLARVMTYRSLYRLEARELLDCPIVGVAFDDWSLEQLVERARESIVATGEELDDEVFARLAKRLSYVHGDFTDCGDVRGGGEGDRRREAARSSTSRSRRRSSARSSAGSRRRVSPRTRASSSRSRSATTSPSARALNAELHALIDESQLYRIDHFLGKMSVEDILYLRFANTILEPVWNRQFVSSRADHDGRGLRDRRPRPLLRPRRRDARRRAEPPPAGAEPRRDGAADRARRGRHQQPQA